MNVADEDAIKFIKIYSLKSRVEIEQIIQDSVGNEHLRIVQKALAEEMTIRVHSQHDLDMAIKATQIFFGNGSADDLMGLDLTTLEASLEGMEMFEVAKSELDNGIPVLDLLAVNTTIFSSKGEARKMIQSNGFAFNKTKEADPNLVVSADKLLHGKYLIAQKGKKQYYLIKAI